MQANKIAPTDDFAAGIRFISSKNRRLHASVWGSRNMLTHNQLRTKALAGLDVKEEFDKLSDEFSLLDEFFKARTQ
jgi:hypothetical protein